MKKVLILLISIVLLLGCKKTTTTTINVSVYNHIYTSMGMNNVCIDIWKQHKNGVKELIHTGLTDPQGKLHYQFTDNSHQKTQFFYEFSGVSSSGTNGPPTSRVIFASDRQLKKNQTNDIKITYALYTTHGMYFKNGNCFDENDRFRFRRMYMNVKDGWSEWSSNKFGCNLISGDSDFQTYNDYIIYEYEVERNGVLNVYKDTVTTRYHMDADTLYY